MLADGFQLVEELRKLRRVDGGFEIEVEPERVVRAWNGAAFQLCQVDAPAIDAGQHLIEAAGFVGERDEQARPVGTGIDLGLGRNADEAGIIAVLVLHALLKRMQTIDFRAGRRGDGGKITPAGLGNHAGRCRRVFAAGHSHVRQLLQKFGALLQCLTMRNDLADLGRLHARQGKQTVIYAQAEGFYKKPVTAAVGFDDDGVITGVYIDASNETADVGGQVGRPRFAGQFVGKTSLDGVDAVAGATISSNAAMDAVQKAIDAFSTVKGA